MVHILDNDSTGSHVSYLWHDALPNQVGSKQEIYKSSYTAASGDNAQGTKVSYYVVTESKISDIAFRDDIFNNINKDGIHDEWGRGINDTHILTAYGPRRLTQLQGGKPHYAGQNVSYDDLGHRSNIYVNKSIGDYEVISSSYAFGKINID